MDSILIFVGLKMSSFRCKNENEKKCNHDKTDEKKYIKRAIRSIWNQFFYNFGIQSKNITSEKILCFLGVCFCGWWTFVSSFWRSFDIKHNKFCFWSWRRWRGCPVATTVHFKFPKSFGLFAGRKQKENIDYTRSHLVELRWTNHSSPTRNKDAPARELFSYNYLKSSLSLLSLRRIIPIYPSS